MNAFNGLTILVTGATGSFGRACVRALLDTEVGKVVIFSRDELKQFQMRRGLNDDPRLRFFLGDVRDLQRLRRAFEGVHVVIHAAALKQVPAAEYNPFEAVKTNIIGAQNVIEAALDTGVEKVLALSTDKAVNPVNLYGATKLCSEKLFVAGNVYVSSADRTAFSCVRYGNVLGSRGSVIEQFREQAKTGTIEITDPRMTRFWITLNQAVALVFDAIEWMQGGEIYVPALPSCRVVDLARAIDPQAEHRITGIRPGEKLYETLLGEDEARRTLSTGEHFVIESEDLIPKSRLRSRGEGVQLPDGFTYRSDNNGRQLNAQELQGMIESAAA